MPSPFEAHVEAARSISQEQQQQLEAPPAGLTGRASAASSAGTGRRSLSSWRSVAPDVGPSGAYFARLRGTQSALLDSSGSAGLSPHALGGSSDSDSGHAVLESSNAGSPAPGTTGASTAVNGKGSAGAQPAHQPLHQRTVSSSSVQSNVSAGSADDEDGSEAFVGGQFEGMADLAGWKYLDVTADGGLAIDMTINTERAATLQKAFSSPHELQYVPSSPLTPAAAAAAAAAGPAASQHGGQQAVHFERADIRPLNVLMLVVGTRGDVQPFIAIGRRMQGFGHRVRLATHAVYREFVEDYGLEFYPLGGDPKVLSEFVVKNRGIVPNMRYESLAEVQQQKRQVRDIVFSTWGACTEADPQHPDKPFKADVIYSNPCTYTYASCAEKLNVPLHMCFTMPWSPTVAFPSPFIRVLQRNQLPQDNLGHLDRTIGNSLASLSKGSSAAAAHDSSTARSQPLRTRSMPLRPPSCQNAAASSSSSSGTDLQPSAAAAAAASRLAATSAATRRSQLNLAAVGGGGSSGALLQHHGHVASGSSSALSQVQHHHQHGRGASSASSSNAVHANAADRVVKAVDAAQAPSTAGTAAGMTGAAGMAAAAEPVSTPAPAAVAPVRHGQHDGSDVSLGGAAASGAAGGAGGRGVAGALWAAGTTAAAEVLEAADTAKAAGAARHRKAADAKAATGTATTTEAPGSEATQAAGAAGTAKKQAAAPTATAADTAGAAGAGQRAHALPVGMELQELPAEVEAMLGGMGRQRQQLHVPAVPAGTAARQAGAAGAAAGAAGIAAEAGAAGPSVNATAAVPAGTSAVSSSGTDRPSMMPHHALSSAVEENESVHAGLASLEGTHAAGSSSGSGRRHWYTIPRHRRMHSADSAMDLTTAHQWQQQQRQQQQDVSTGGSGRYSTQVHKLQQQQEQQQGQHQQQQQQQQQEQQHHTGLSRLKSLHTRTKSMPMSPFAINTTQQGLMEWLTRSGRTAGSLLNPNNLISTGGALLNPNNIISAGGALLNPNNLITAGNFLSAAVRPSALLAGANWYSYYAADDMVWLGGRSALHDFRKKVLQLPARNPKAAGPHTLHDSQVPMTYIWSPALVPKPNDWGPHINVVGFAFVDDGASTDYEPPPELKAFLEAGPPPLYIGFGSLVVEDPGRLTHRILKAIAATGERAILQRGWGGLGTGLSEAVPDNVMIIDACPHDWLFPRCRAVVHHGGAGTTACGLRYGRPTLVVPFFGDQSFWGCACHRAGVGPRPLPIDSLNSRRLATALRTLLQPEAEAAARKVANMLALEDGAGAAVDAFHAHMARAGLFDVPKDSQQPLWLKNRAEGSSSGAVSDVSRNTRQQELLVLPRDSRSRAGDSSVCTVSDDLCSSGVSHVDGVDGGSTVGIGLSSSSSMHGAVASIDAGISSQQQVQQHEQQRRGAHGWLSRHVHKNSSSEQHATKGRHGRRSRDGDASAVVDQSISEATEDGSGAAPDLEQGRHHRCTIS